MQHLEEKPVTCPYCGEAFTVLVDCSVMEQTYVEDCEVCCQPVLLDVTIEDEQVLVQARREND